MALDHCCCPVCSTVSALHEVFIDPGTLYMQCPACSEWSHQDQWSDCEGPSDGDPNDPGSYDTVQDPSGNVIQCSYCGSHNVGEVEFPEGVFMCCCDCNVILDL